MEYLLQYLNGYAGVPLEGKWSCHDLGIKACVTQNRQHFILLLTEASQFKERGSLTRL